MAFVLSQNEGLPPLRSSSSESLQPLRGSSRQLMTHLSCWVIFSRLEYWGSLTMNMHVSTRMKRSSGEPRDRKTGYNTTVIYTHQRRMTSRRVTLSSVALAVLGHPISAPVWLHGDMNNLSAISFCTLRSS